jgi:histidyl-tRNA synthetase
MRTQAVRGTRDFYPEDMAFRRWLVEVWRRVSRRAGFLEVDGPELEPLELYTGKSGEEIVEQIYWLQDKSGRRLALRPEFTPTLARMVAARQAALPEPVRWFNVSRCFRYERAQKGRQREFFQWNVDLLGVEGEVADAECIWLAVDALEELGLRPDDAEVLVSDRRLTSALLRHLGIPAGPVEQVFASLDKRDRAPPEALAEMLETAGLDARQREGMERILGWRALSDIDGRELATDEVRAAAAAVERLFARLADYGLAEWCRFDIGIVRGLAYYTGPVWEVRDRKGELRAVFGGGRYDRLLEDLGGKPMPACGFGCGDVVLGILLEERGLAPEPEAAAEYYVASARGERWPDVLRVVRHLRGRKRDTQFDPKGGGLKRQLRKAADAGARYTVIVGDEACPPGAVVLRDMRSGHQQPVPVESLGDEPR